MNARMAGERPSPVGCVVRRCLAKAVDVLLFAAVSFLIALFVLREPLRFDGLVPAFLSSLWVLGFVVSADIASALLFGATPGELLAGIRVMTLEDGRLAFSQRQDRTTDAFVDGTLGCMALLSLFWQRQPAPYDKGCTIYFARLTPQRLLVSLLALLAASAMLVAAALMLGVGELGDKVPAPVMRLIRQAGFDVREQWRNPLTGKAIGLPEGWRVANSTYRPALGDMRVDFTCAEDAGDAPCLVRLAVWPGELDVLEYDVERYTDASALDSILRTVLLADYDEGSLDARDTVEGLRRLELLYSARLSFDRSEAANAAGTAIIWFSDKRHTWALAVVHPERGSTGIADAAYRLAFGLVASTREAK